MSTTPFDNAIRIVVVGNEGGYQLSTLSHDAGGRTFAGIAENYWPKWEGWAMLDNGMLPNDQRVIDAVSLFYRVNYWLPICADNLPPYMALHMFDFAINTSTGRAIRVMQRCIGVKDDGDIGAATIAAARNVDPAKFIRTFNAARLRFYTSREKWQYFGESWTNRVATMLECVV